MGHGLSLSMLCECVPELFGHEVGGVLDADGSALCDDVSGRVGALDFGKAGALQWRVR
jgi:hypothetical protein